MEPGARTRRPTPMRALALSFAALIVPLSLAACGSSDDGDDVATDPAPTTATSTPSPTAEPTVGTYPEFAPTDYTFELTVSCFCAGGGTPIKVTVAEADVVGAIYTTDSTGRGGAQAGDTADNSYWLTINDIIDKANDTKADRVDVDWPAGQDYPTSVYVDSEKTMADEEVSYTIGNVVVS
jgi:hypothetical protein